MPDPTDLKQEDDSVDLLISAHSESPAVASKKVELDLDDAPFLQTERENAPTATHEVAVPNVPEDEAERLRRLKRKRMLMAGAAAALLAIGAAIWWFFFREQPVESGIEPEVIVVPSNAAPVGPDEIVRPFEPFVVPVKDGAGHTSFLICKFSALTQDPNINQEIDKQRTALRDAIYFYLRSKDSNYLLDARNAKAIKTDLLSIFNDYLTQGKLEDILFESYLSR